ncbi:MAG: PEP-CTERM sorting domain-containing protein, partial [Candidatus Thiodiazotropha sp.]
IMLVFKGGDETTLAGYLLDGQSTSGTWMSPFRSPDFDVRNVKDVSHISFYGTGTSASAAVPEPSALMLMSLGLAGIGVARRSRKKTV